MFETNENKKNLNLKASAIIETLNTSLHRSYILESKFNLECFITVGTVPFEQLTTN